MKKVIIFLISLIAILAIIAGCSRRGGAVHSMTFESEVLEVRGDTIFYSGPEGYEHERFVYTKTKKDDNLYEVGQQIDITIETDEHNQYVVLESNPPKLHIQSITIK
ncbi:hypothetical protein GCM10007425_06880 [Lysinibacillus alkalisoli]|uniref:DUF3221 domain-containing protein n=1 Tax=Lysinibacillus alkalisoli TaxID=1911548 RepID=A0A917LDH2_9BACI|nr:hypothetical protein [Lysinibacillus alkalisoli]GGG15219.1 hypothetical protein GCM10007425_06880 [Lysinibacillus alkalisoli]